MAKLGWRVRSLAWVLAHTPGGSAAGLSPDQMLKAQERLAGHGKLTVGVTGGLARGVQTENRLIDQDGQQVPIRIYRAEDGADRGPVIVHFHGGGWSLGALDQSDWLCSQVCIGVGAVVVSVDYRLAPTYRFPTAVIDSLAAVNWVAANGTELNVDVSRIGLMGDSAGGNLATVVSQLLRDKGGPKITHQALMYPATDLRNPEDFDAGSPARADWPILSSASMVAFRDHYLGPEGDPNDPMASPILADDLSGLPPALIQVAEYDPLRDDGIRYARALQAAGTPVRLTEYVGMPHGYFSFPKVIRGSIVQALAELCAEQRYALHGVPSLDRTVPTPPAGRGEIPLTATSPDQSTSTSPDPAASRPVPNHDVGRSPVPQHSVEANAD
jgi:acetyl esterase